MIGRSVSHYKILERVGGGGMGVVYKAEDTKLRSVVALKFLPQDLVADEVAKTRFIREAQASAALRHINICSVHDLDETDDGQLFIAMDYCGGQSLRDRIDEGPLPPRSAFEVTMQVAGALRRAHAGGIIHRDIKPGNVMFDDDGYVKIVDFGLAKLIDRTSVTRSAYTVGTAAYMSPEQASGSDVDGRTDVWALGVLFFEMLTAQKPFRGDVEAAIFYAVMSEEPAVAHEVNPDVPEQLSRIIHKCLHKDLGARYQSMDELMVDMDAAARELGYGSSVIHPVPPMKPKKPRRPRRRIAAIALVIAIAASWFVVFGPGGGEPSIYVTDTRLAVLPLENLMPSEQDVFVDGVSQHVSMIVEDLLRADDDAWVVPYSRVLDAPITSPTDAVGAFGANQVVIGNVQRFGNRRRVNLRLCNAADLSELASTNVDFGDTGVGLGDSLASAVAGLLSRDVDDVSSGMTPSNPAAAIPYATGLGWLQRSQGAGTDSARVYFQRAVDIDAAFAMGHAMLGNTGLHQFRRHDPDANRLLVAATPSLEHALELSPTLFYANLIAAHVYYYTGDYDSSIERCDAALREAPGALQPSLRRAWALNRQDRHDEAEAAFLAAIERTPDYWAAHMELGVLYWANGNTDDAIAVTEEAVLFAPNDVTSVNNLGAFHSARDEWDKVRTYFTRAFEISPNCDTCSNMGWLAYFEGNYADAARYYGFAIEYCDSTDYQLYGNLAAAQYWAGGMRDVSMRSYATAIRHAHRVLSDDPDNPTVMAQLLDYYSMSGDVENTRRMIDYCKDHGGENETVLYSVASAHEILGERRTAIRHAVESVRRGYPLSELESSPLMRELAADSTFRKMISRINESPSESSR